MSSIIEKVETFIQRLHDLDYTITPEAKEIWYVSSSQPPLVPKDRRTLSDYLANAISDYQSNKNDEERRLGYAQICLIWINRAFACGIIKEGQGLTRKLSECREKNAQLERDLETLSGQYLQLQREYAAFTSRIKLPDKLPDESDLEGER